MRDIVTRVYRREAVEYLAQRILRCDNMRDIVSVREGEWNAYMGRAVRPAYQSLGPRSG